MGWKKHFKHVCGACVFHILVVSASVWLSHSQYLADIQYQSDSTAELINWNSLSDTWSSQLSNIWADVLITERIRNQTGLKKSTMNKTPSNFGHCEFDLYVNVNYINIFNRICPRSSTHKQSLSLIHLIWDCSNREGKTDDDLLAVRNG